MAVLSTIVAPGNILTASNTATLTNKTISGTNNTLTVRMASDVSGTLPVANGGTGLTALGTAGQVLTVNAGATALEFAAAAGGSSGVSYPQSIKSADYTLVLGDAGYQIFHPATDTELRTFTIPANSSVAFPIGTTVLFANENGAKLVVVSITTDTLVTTRSVTGSKVVPAGEILTAIKVTDTKWMCFLTGEYTTTQQMIAVAHSGTPYVSAYRWSSSGFGTKFSNPSTLPTGDGHGIAFSPAGTEVAVAHYTSPYVSAYPWSSSGFGAKFSNPGTLPTGNGMQVAFSPAGNAIAVAHYESPFVSVYPWSSSGFGTKFTNPGTLPTSSGIGVTFSPAGNAIAVASQGTPYIFVYPWTYASGFGSKYSNPATIPTGSGYSVAFSPAGTEIAIAHSESPFISTYPWTYASGFGTKFSNPASGLSYEGTAVAFSPAGTEIVIGNTYPYLFGYRWSSSGFGTKFSDPATMPPAAVYGVAFSPAGTEVAAAHGQSPYVSAYPWSSSGFGTKFTNPGTAVGGTYGHDVAFTNN